MNRDGKTRNDFLHERICGTRNAGLSKFVLNNCASTSYFSAHRLRCKKLSSLDGC